MNLESIVTISIPEGREKKTLKKQSTEKCDFMKQEYETHLDTDKDPAHDTGRELLGCEVYNGSEDYAVEINGLITERCAHSCCTTFL